MLPYIIFYAIVFVLSFKVKKGKWRIWDFLLLILMVLFSSIRYGIGTDYLLYNRMYNSVSLLITKNFGTTRTGMGFTKLMYQFHDVWNLDYKVFIFLCALVTITCIFIFFKNTSNNPGRSILIYIALGAYTSSFNGYRQYLSISILLLAFLLFQNRKYFVSILLALISILMHSASLIPLIIYLLIFRFKKFEIKPLFVLLISILCFVFYNQIFNYFIFLSDAYSGYATYDSIPGIGTYLTVTFYYLMYLLLLVPNRNKFDEKTKIYFNLASIGVCIMSLQLHNWLFNRIVEMFTIFMPIVLSEYYDHINEKNNKIVSLLFHTIAFVYFIIFINSFGGVVPYTTIF